MIQTGCMEEAWSHVRLKFSFFFFFFFFEARGERSSKLHCIERRGRVVLDAAADTHN